MDMTGEYRIAAPRETVWAALNDVDVLKECIPGWEEIEQVSPTEMTAKVVQKIGPVKARFEGAIELRNFNAPANYTIKGEGQGGVAGFAKGRADGHLFGATAKKPANTFFENFHDHLSDGGPSDE